MEIDYGPTAGSFVKAIDVLSHQQLDAARSFESCQSPVCLIRRGAPEVPPANEASGPVPFANGLMVHEGLEHHRWGAFPVAIGIPIVRNAGIRAAAGAGQDEEPCMTVDEFAQEADTHPIEHKRGAQRRPCSPRERAS